MKKNKDIIFKSITDLKIFLLFILDNLRYPAEEATVLEIAEKSTNELILDYAECLAALTDSGHLLYDEIDGTKYYMISKKGRETSAELYDLLDESFRENTLRSVAKYLSVSKLNAKIQTYIEKTEAKRYRVTIEANDEFGDLMKLSLTVNSLIEAQKIKENFEEHPDGVYKGALLSATGRIEFLS